MILDWFDAREAEAFASELAGEIDRLFPVEVAEKNKSPSAKKEQKDQKKLDGLVLRTRTFGQTHKLNVYKKAKLLNAIKWHMREKGHEEALTDELLRLLTPQLNR